MTKTQRRIVPITSRATSEDGLAWFRMTVEVVDRHGSVFYVKGCKLDGYLKNPVVLLDHDNSVRSIAGHAEQIRIVDDGGVGAIDLGIRFAETEEPSDAGSLAARLYRAGFLRAMSHVFMPLRVRYGHEITDDERARWPQLGKWGFIVDEWELREASFVGVGSNPDALKRAVDAGELRRSDLRALAGKAARRGAREAAASVAVDAGALLARLTELEAAVRDGNEQALDTLQALMQANHAAVMAAVARIGAPPKEAATVEIATQKSIEAVGAISEIVERFHKATRGVA